MRRSPRHQIGGGGFFFSFFFCQWSVLSKRCKAAPEGRMTR